MKSLFIGKSRNFHLCASISEALNPSFSSAFYQFNPALFQKLKQKGIWEITVLCYLQLYTATDEVKVDRIRRVPTPTHPVPLSPYLCPAGGGIQSMGPYVLLRCHPPLKIDPAPFGLCYDPEKNNTRKEVC